MPAKASVNGTKGRIRCWNPLRL